MTTSPRFLPGLGVEHDPGGKTRTNCRDRAVIYGPLITGPQNAFISDSLYDIFIIINGKGRHSLKIHTQPVGYTLNLWYLYLSFKIFNFFFQFYAISFFDF